MGGPSRRRREGREAFEPGVDPKDVNPYLKSPRFTNSYAEDFYDGWKEAEERFEEEEALTPSVEETLERLEARIEVLERIAHNHAR